MTGYCLFNTSFLDGKDFQDQLVLILKRELMVGNKQWGHLKSNIRYFAAEYNCQDNSNILAAQKALKLGDVE